MGCLVGMRRTLVKTRGRRCAAGGPALAVSLAPPAEQDQILGDDLRAVLLFAALLVFPARSLDSAFNVDLGAFLHVFADDLRQALPSHNVVPLGAVLPFAGFVFVTLVGGQAELGYRDAARRVLDLRILAQVPDQNHFVNALWHEGSAFCGLNCAKYTSVWRFVKVRFAAIFMFNVSSRRLRRGPRRSDTA